MVRLFIHLSEKKWMTISAGGGERKAFELRREIIIQ